MDIETLNNYICNNNYGSIIIENNKKIDGVINEIDETQSNFNLDFKNNCYGFISILNPYKFKNNNIKDLNYKLINFIKKNTNMNKTNKNV